MDFRMLHLCYKAQRVRRTPCPRTPPRAMRGFSGWTTSAGYSAALQQTSREVRMSLARNT
jgi:hypothetical protein